jgi:hypothetical protein
VATRGDTNSDKAHTAILPRVLFFAAIDSRDSFFGGGGDKELWAKTGECLDRVDQNRLMGTIDVRTIDVVGVNVGRVRIRNEEAAVSAMTCRNRLQRDGGKDINEDLGDELHLQEHGKEKILSNTI